jgi:hypothetical protein
MKVLDKFIGYGRVTDKKFGQLVEAVLDNATFLKEVEEVSFKCDMITGYYHYCGNRYELWYQARNNESPEGTEYTYGFSKK